MQNLEVDFLECNCLVYAAAMAVTRLSGSFSASGRSQSKRGSW